MVVAVLRGVLLSVLGAAGCVGAIDDPESFTVDNSCVDVDKKILGSRCSSAACHEASKPAAGLDLISPGVASRLMDRGSDGCSGRLLIDRAKPLDSFLLEKVGPNIRCGERMPLGRATLTDQEVSCLADWVSKVAGGSVDEGDSGPGLGDGGTTGDAAGSDAGGDL